MGDKKMEQSIKVIALVLLFGALAFHTPSSVNSPEDIIDAPPCNTDNLTQQEKDSCLSAKIEGNLCYGFMYEVSDSLLNCMNTSRE